MKYVEPADQVIATEHKKLVLAPESGWCNVRMSAQKVRGQGLISSPGKNVLSKYQD